MALRYATIEKDKTFTMFQARGTGRWFSTRSAQRKLSFFGVTLNVVIVSSLTDTLLPIKPFFTSEDAVGVVDLLC